MASDETTGFRALWTRIKAALSPPSTAPNAPAGASLPSSFSDVSRPAADTIAELDPAALLDFARSAPLVYGNWGDLKRLYKHAESTNDAALLGTLIGRLDAAPFPDTRTFQQPFGPPTSNYYTSQHAVGPNRVYTVGYVDAEYCLSVFDTSDPAAPIMLGRLKIDYANKVACSGTQVYVTSTGYGSNSRFYVVDASEGSKPKIQGWLKLEQLLDVTVDNGYVYVLTGQRGRTGAQMHIIDVSVPTRPVIAGAVECTGPRKVMVRGNLAAVVEGRDYYSNSSQEGVRIIDVSNLKAPRMVEMLAVENVTDAVLTDHFLYVASANQHTYGQSNVSGLFVFDLQIPIGRRKGTRFDVGNAVSLAISDKLAFVGLADKGRRTSADYQPGELRVLDLSDPARPQQIARWGKSTVTMLTLQGTQLYLSSVQRTYQQVLRVLDVSRPTQPFLLGDPPSRRTLGYMKRRARRNLRELARTNSELWTKVALETLKVSGHGLQSVSPTHQWVSMDLLFGGSDRWTQGSHGRSVYRIAHPRFLFRRREDRNPDLWNLHREAVRDLLNTPDLPWQTHEFAVKVLLSNREALPDLPNPVAARWLLLPSPLLISLATRQTAQRFSSGETISPESAANTYFLASGKLRRSMEVVIAAQGGTRGLSADWKRAFVETLLARANSSGAGKSAQRRSGVALALLVRHFESMLVAKMDADLAARLFVSGDAASEAAALRFLRSAPPAIAPRWLANIESMAPARREAAFTAFRDNIASKGFGDNVLNELVFSNSEWVRERGWDLIVASQTKPNLIGDLWRSLLSSTSTTPALETAMRSPAALDSFASVPDAPSWLMERLAESPFLVGLVTPEMFGIVVRTLPPAATLRLIASAEESRWPELRQAAISALESPTRLAAFWQAALALLGGDENPVLHARLLEDPQMRSLFLMQDDGDILRTSNPDFGDILREWAQAHEAQMTRDSPLLLQAATHPLPPVRDWALARAQSLGFGLPFALRLLESELPPSFAVGQTFFEAASDDERILDYAVALCDSPKKTTRTYGLDYATRRLERLPESRLLARLAENPAPEVQTWVAARALAQPAALADAPAFDRDVLRGRNRSRQAKELVKKRLNAPPAQAANLTQMQTVDIPTLLELARSRTPRDAEWALQQLARLALEGQTIEGVALG